MHPKKSLTAIAPFVSFVSEELEEKIEGIQKSFFFSRIGNWSAKLEAVSLVPDAGDFCERFFNKMMEGKEIPVISRELKTSASVLRKVKYQLKERDLKVLCRKVATSMLRLERVQEILRPREQRVL